MPTAPPTIVVVPDPPSTADPSNFDAKGDAFLGVFPDLRDDLQDVADITYANALEVFAAATDLEAAAAVAAGATNLLAFSTSTLTVGAGTQTIHFTSPKTGFAVNDQVAIVLRSDTSIKMFGTVATFDGTDDMTVTVISSGVFGSGLYSSWVILSTAFLSAGATPAQVRAGSTDAVAVTPKSLTDANAPVALTYASTITLDLSISKRFTLTASASFTLAPPINAAPGDVIELLVTNSAASIVLATSGSVWKRQFGPFVMDPASGHTNKITGVVESVDGSKVATWITYGGQRNPTS